MISSLSDIDPSSFRRRTRIVGISSASNTRHTWLMFLGSGGVISCPSFSLWSWGDHTAPQTTQHGETKLQGGWDSGATIQHATHRHIFFGGARCLADFEYDSQCRCVVLWQVFLFVLYCSLILISSFRCGRPGKSEGGIVGFMSKGGHTIWGGSVHPSQLVSPKGWAIRTF